MVVNKVLNRKPPGSFWAIAVGALLWNAMGVFAYFTQVTASSEQLAEAYSPAHLAILEATPVWATSAFAIAVFGGLIAAIGLLARKSWARIVFIISLAAVLVQQVWTFFLSGYLDVLPITAAFFPVLVVVIGVFEIWYAGQATKRGWLR